MSQTDSIFPLRKNKLKGLLVGLVIGDCIGLATYNDAPKIETTKFQPPWDDFYTTIKKKKTVPGQCTATSELCVVIGQALLAMTDDQTESITTSQNGADSWQIDVLQQAYLTWSNPDKGRYRPAIKNPLENLFSGYKKLSTLQNRLQQNKEQRSQCQTNDLLVRHAILMPVDNLVWDIREETKLTHDNYLSKSILKIYAFILRMLAIGHSIESLMPEVKKLIKEETVIGDIYQAAVAKKPIRWSSKYKDLDPELLKISKPWQGHYKSWIGCALYFVFWSLTMLHSKADPLSIYYTLAFIPFSDTINNCAIVGAVLGACKGTNMLRSRTLMSYWKRIISADTTAGDLPRPDEYHPKQISNLANRLDERFGLHK